MPPRITNPHVELEHGYRGQSGEPGKLPGHAHASDDDGLVWQCAICELVTTYAWKDVDDTADWYLKLHGEGELDAIPLPPCPGCGAVPCLNHSNMEYGSDLPHHYTHRVVHEHLMTRPRLRGRFRVNHFEEHERYHGHDFSHLPPAKRPKHHRKIGKAEVDEAIRQHRGRSE